jgi:hypothetical protein
MRLSTGVSDKVMEAAFESLRKEKERFMKFIGVLLMGIAFSFPVWAADSPTTPKQGKSGDTILNY